MRWTRSLARTAARSTSARAASASVVPAAPGPSPARTVSRFPRMGTRRLLKSWAMPLASVPTASCLRASERRCSAAVRAPSSSSSRCMIRVLAPARMTMRKPTLYATIRHRRRAFSVPSAHPRIPRSIPRYTAARTTRTTPRAMAADRGPRRKVASITPVYSQARAAENGPRVVMETTPTPIQLHARKNPRRRVLGRRETRNHPTAITRITLATTCQRAPSRTMKVKAL